jgi:deoxycytidylate deaminase
MNGLILMMSTKSPLKKTILHQAFAVAMASNAPKKIGAILLKRNRIIASAVNDYTRTHPVQYWAAQNAARIFNEPQLENKTYLHAELRSLIKAKEDADTIVVCRVGGHGGHELRMSRPCRVCESYIRSCSSVIHIHYSTPQGFMYEYWGT